MKTRLWECFVSDYSVERKSDVLNLKLFYVISRDSSDDDAESYGLLGSQMLNVSQPRKDEFAFCGIKIRTRRRWYNFEKLYDEY